MPQRYLKEWRCIKGTHWQYDSFWQNLRTVFDNLEKAKLQVNIEKTNFLSTHVEFLGYVVTADGIKPDEKWVEGVRV